ncbi:MAG: hypothetical protein DMG36_18180 [Acidobacteria bacterium]|nr:MAG: hypothetical protein DMG36_18180 [Acidobacteriota bacterium]
MPKFRAIVLVFCFATFLFPLKSVCAQEAASAIVVLNEAGLPSAESPAFPRQQLAQALPQARFASAEQLPTVLDETSTRLLVLPYGSAFPEENWSAIHAFLGHGGNLLVLGGRPFTRAAYHDGSGWHLRDYSVRFIRQLSMDQFQTTPGSAGLEFQNNADVSITLPRFSWQRAFSPIIRLSAVGLYNRGGSAGSIDARLDPLAWGIKDGRKMAAPAMEIDHLRNGFDGGRWIFLSSELDSQFLAGTDAISLIRILAERARQGSEEFTARPSLPLYLPAEPVEVEVLWHAAEKPSGPLTVRISEFPESQPSQREVQTANLSRPQTILLPAPKEKGFHVIQADLLEGNTIRATYRSGFWIRDHEFLRSGPHLTVNHDFFEIDGHPLAVVGTTYMSSEVQRLYFDHPNAFVWDRDMTQIQAAGLNMLRTGWWTGWDKFCDENGQPYERTLRTLEAYLMTARKHGLPVQFNFFAFLPEVLGGVNPYLDPQALRKQQTLVSTVVARFHDVPFLAWDLINEPSISQHLWQTRPNGDPIELAAWNQWLSKRYPDRAALAAAWNAPHDSIAGNISLPGELEFSSRGMYEGHNSLRVYDYFVFAQETFVEWVRAMRDKIRGTGSQQLITVGQDEGGVRDRLSPAFYAPAVDFTTNHSWWGNDSLLWDSLTAKQPSEAMLIQETGLQREINLDESARFTPEQEASLFERKVALSFVQGSGTIEWLWNTNSYMTAANEAPIGAVRADGTEKPEAAVMRDFARFAKSLHSHLQNPHQPSVAMVTSQAAQFSVFSDLQLEAQQKAVRALAYGLHITPYIIAENQIAKLGAPQLVILPSPQSLNDNTWQALLAYAKGGGNLLITGPVSRDEHWQFRDRPHDLGLNAQIEPQSYRGAEIRLPGKTMPLSFDQQKQFSLEALRFSDVATWKEIPSGKGKVFWSSYSLELAEGLDAAASVYGYLLATLKIKPAFDLHSAPPPGVLIYSAELQDSVLYILESENAADTAIDLRDAVTGARLTLKLQAQHAALALIGKQEKAVIARYGF